MDTIRPLVPDDHDAKPANQHHNVKQSTRMNHFCLPISFTSSSHHSTLLTSNKLRKKDGRSKENRPSHTVTTRDSNTTSIRLETHQAQRFSIQRTARQKPDGDTVWLQYPAQLEPYTGFEYDEDLNSPDGDCLVYFEQADQRTRSTPTFQVHSDRIRGANIAFLNDLLRVSRRQKLRREAVIEAYPRSEGLILARRELRRRSLLPFVRLHSPLKFPEFDPQNRSPARQKRLSWDADEQLGPHYSLQKDLLDDEENSDAEDYQFSNVKFEIVFATREGTKHIYELAIRNLFAILEKRSIVGKDLIQTLGDVQDLLDAFDVSPASKNSSTSGSGTTVSDARLVTSYVEEMRLDDIRYDLDGALMMLAWTESPSVRWSPGYFENFVHVVGLMTSTTKESSTFQLLSMTTQNNLKGAHEALELVITMTEEKLHDFALREVWSSADVTGKENLTPVQLLHMDKQASSVRTAAEAFKAFLVSYYTQLFGTWPPSAQDSGHWLNRAVINRLQRDFGLLYEYLVDKDVMWDNLVANGRRDWEMYKRHDNAFRADDHVSLTDMLISFDNANDFSHIPRPFPLLPVGERKMKRRSIFGKLMGSKTAEAVARIEALSNASNKDLDREESDFLAAFKQHEASFSVTDVSTIEARLSRWIQLYAILQTVSHLSVDVPGLRYTADVDYFLCFGLNGHPSWTTSSTAHSAVVMPSQEASCCWTAATRWEEEFSERSSDCDVIQRTRQESSTTPSDSGVDTSPSAAQEHFVMPDGSLIPLPNPGVLRCSPTRPVYPPSPPQASVSALPRIPEKSEKRRLSFAPSAISTITTNSMAAVDNVTQRSPQRRRAARVSITPSLQSEPDDQQDMLKKKRETITSMDDTEWADTEFSGEGGDYESNNVEADEAMAVQVKRGVKKKLVEGAMSSTGSVAHSA